MDVSVGKNRNGPGVFRVAVPTTDHRWRGFCECGAPKDDLCGLDEESDGGGCGEVPGVGVRAGD